MRSGPIAAAILVLLLLPSASALGAAAPPPTPPPAAGAAGPSAAGPPNAQGPVGGDVRSFPGHPLPLNVTLAPSLLPARPAAGPPPISARQVTPLPHPPSTTPTAMSFLNASTACCVSANFTAPAGAWQMIVLNYTGQAVGGVYDSSFRAYVDQVQVLFGTTPEYGVWFVSKDITRYTSLFNGTFNFTFLLSAATVGGYFLTTVSIAFYPAPPGGVVPSEPDRIVPLFHRVFVSPSSLTVTSAATVPSNVVNATLEFWTYAFDADEFWYTTQPGFRAAFVDVDGSPIAATFPFPFVNTGGSDPFAWRPITAAFTLDNPAYEFDVTAALGLIEGTHNFTANVSGAGPGSNWLIGGALLLYTDPSAGAASLLSYAASTPRATLSTDHSTYYDQTDSVSYAYASSVPEGTGARSVALFSNATYSSAMALSPTWTNLTMRSSFSSHVIDVGADGRRDVLRSSEFPFAIDLGGTFVLTSSTNGGYPKFGNFTESLLNAYQAWDESTVTTSTTVGGTTATSYRSMDQRVIGGNNLYAGTEELTGPNAALITGITFLESQTTDRYAEREYGGALPYEFDHLLIGSAYQPPGPYQVETVVVDDLAAPVHARLTLVPEVTEVGASTAIVAAADGGNGSYVYAYEGFPAGCASSDSAALACTPSQPGVYLILVDVADRDGLAAVPAYATLVVNAVPTVTIGSESRVAEVGRNTNFSATVALGTGPFVCAWSLDGELGPTQPCDQPFAVVPNATGSATVNVSVTDAAGGSASASATIDVAPSTSVVLRAASPTNLTVGDWLILIANVSGALPVVTTTWYASGAEPAPIASPPLTRIFQVTTPGSFQEVVTVVDSAGGSATSAPLVYNVSAAPAPTTGATSSEAPLVGPGLYLGLLVGVVVGAAVGLLLARRRRPPA